MERFKMKKGSLLLVVLMCVGMTAFAEKGKKEYTEEVKKEFNINKDGKVSLSNKHGSITVNTWDRKKVKIKVVMTVSAKSRSEAEQLFDELDIEFESSNSEVSAMTVRESNEKWWSWRKYTNSIAYRVDYEVSMPETAKLDLDNKYGDIYIEDIYGKTDIQAAHGNLKMGKLTASTDMDLSYMRTNIEEMTNGDIEVKYGKLIIGTAKNLDIDSKYSKIYIEKAGDMETDSKYDKYEIGTINKLDNDGKYDTYNIESLNTIETDGKFSDYIIDDLMESGDFDNEYGEIILKKVNKGFSTIEIEGKHTNVRIYLGTGAASNFEFTGERANVDLPKGAKIRVDKEDEGTREVQAKIGTNPKGAIKVTMEYGGIEINK